MIEIEDFNSNHESWYNLLHQNNEAPYLYSYPWYLKAIPGDLKIAFNAAKTFGVLFLEQSKLGLMYLPYSNFVQQYEPVGRATQLILDDLHDALLGRYWKLDFRAHSSLSCEKINYQRAQNFELKLTKSIEELQSAFGSNHKRALKKATKHQLSIVYSAVAQELNEAITWFKMHNKSGAKQTVAFYETLKNIAVAAEREKALELVFVEHENQGIAACMLVHTKNRITVLFTASLPIAKELGANHFVIFKIIEKYANSGKILDFEGSNNKNLAFFYKNFGSSAVDYFVWQKKNLPFAKLKKA